MEYFNISNSITWQNLPWNKINEKLFNLQRRIYKASQRCDYTIVHKLQNYLIDCDYIKMIAIQNVSENLNKYYLVYDEEKYLINNQEKFTILQQLNCKKNTSSQFFKDKVKQYLVYLCLQPEWTAKLEPLYYESRNTSKNRLDARIKRFFCTNFKFKAYSMCSLIISNKHAVKYISKEYLCKKLQTIPSIVSNINLWLDQQGFLEPLINSKTGWEWLLPEEDKLFMLIEKIIYTGLEWSIFSCTQLRYKINNNCKFLVIFYDKSKFFYFDNCQICFYLVKDIQNFFVAVGCDPNLIVLNNIQANSSNLKILEFSLTNKIKSYKYKYAVEPSKKAIENLIRKIKYLLYHKNQKSKLRSSNHLSISLSTKLIYIDLYNWHMYFNQTVDLDMKNRIYCVVEEILYRWYTKRSTLINKKVFQENKNLLSSKFHNLHNELSY
nr:hypothetical protein Ahn.pli.UK.pt_236 [Ahnfeltia plicata]